jgi:MFS family permease
MLQELRDGMAYAFRAPLIRDLILLQALVSLVTVQYTILPVAARELLHGGSNALGLLMGCAGVGALLGAIFLASRQGVGGALVRIGLVGFVFSLALIGFGLSGALWLSLGLQLVIGFSGMMIPTSGFTLLQMVVADDKRGRVISLYLVAVLGTMPLGNLLLGGLADSLGVGPTFVLSGVGSLAGFVWFATRLRALQPLLESAIEEKAAPGGGHAPTLSDADQR